MTAKAKVLSQVEQDRRDFWLLQQVIEQPVICTWFGCGKKLTREEQLCGHRCCDHQQSKRTDPMKVIKMP